jgi:predicted  nucleic acid-binding Zn-ribbon protein
MSCERFTANSLEPEDHLVFAARTDDGLALDDTECRRLLDLPGTVGAAIEAPHEVMKWLEEARAEMERPIMEALSSRNAGWFDAEMDKLDRWADDRRAALKIELADLDDRVKEMKKSARLAPNLPEKLERQREAKRLEARRDEAWRGYDRASRDLEKNQEELLDEVSRRMLTYVERTQLFTVRWQLR